MINLYGFGGALAVGTWITVNVTLTALTLGLCIGLIGASAKLSRFFVFRLGADAYTTIICGLPGYCNKIILLLKSTSLASTITLLELTGITRNIIAVTFKPVELFILAGIIYMMLTFVLTRLFNLVEYKITAHRRPVTEPAAAG